MIFMLASLSAVSACKKRSTGPKAAVKRPVKPRARVARDALTERCRVQAVSARGKATGRVDPESVPLPPRAADGGDPAARRLKALRAIDAINTLLKRAPRHPELHYRLGLVHLESMENPEAAIGHLCRALLGDPKEQRYRRTVLAAWMVPGRETQLELALAPSHTSLRWRRALDEARKLTGVDRLERAAAFDASIEAQAAARASRALRREVTRAKVQDIASLIRVWAQEGPADSVRVVVTFPERLRSRVRSYRHREQDPVAGSLVYASPGPGPRWTLHGRGAPAIKPVVEAARGRLRGKRIGISVAQNGRRLYLVGQLGKDHFDVRAYASKPAAPSLQALLGLAPP